MERSGVRKQEKVERGGEQKKGVIEGRASRSQIKDHTHQFHFNPTMKEASFGGMTRKEDKGAKKRGK